MEKVRPKKHLGQHFLTDLGIAEKITQSLRGHEGVRKVLEIGPGMGVLTDFLIPQGWDLYLVDIDKESVAYLNKKYPDLGPKIIEADFLKQNVGEVIGEKYIIIGNFPYNISSQIFFKILPERDQVVEVVCMLQKEVAQRIASPKGNRDYGILSVFLQAFYDIEYLFDVSSEVFDPPPKVTSGVIRLVRNQVQSLGCDEKLFFRVVKQAFSMRRKTLRNALKPMGLTEELNADPILDKRAERLGVEEFVQLTNKIQAAWKQ